MVSLVAQEPLARPDLLAVWELRDPVEQLDAMVLMVSWAKSEILASPDLWERQESQELPVLQVTTVPQVFRDAQVTRVSMVMSAFPEPPEHQASRDHLDQQVASDHQEKEDQEARLVQWDPLDQLDLSALQAHKDQLDPMVRKVTQERMATKETSAGLVCPDLTDLRDHLASLVPPDHRDHLDQEAMMDHEVPWDPREQSDLRDLLDVLDHVDLLVKMEDGEHRERLDVLDPQDHPDNLSTLLL